MVSALERWVSFVGTNQWYQHSRGGFLLLGQISGISTREAGFLGWGQNSGVGTEEMGFLGCDKPVRSTLKRSVFWVSFCGPLTNIVSDDIDNNIWTLCCQQ